MVELAHVTKKYGSLTALQDVSFRIRERETVGLLGRNGAGKSTLLNLLTGYFPPTAGEIRIGGESMAKNPAACKRMIGYLPEKPPLYDEMTTESYLRFVCELREVKKKAVPAHIDEILHLCGLEEVRGRVLGHLSRGYRQRAGIAQALCGAPEILILDEPTAGLDPKQTVEIRELIRRLSGEHTVLFSSHILPEVQQACTRVLILDEGCLTMDYDAQKPADGVLRLRLLIAGDPEKTLNRLRRLDGFTAAERIRASQGGPSAQTGAAEFLAAVRCGTAGPADSGAALDRAFRTLADSGLAIRMMREEKETLEEVFLRATRPQAFTDPS